MKVSATMRRKFLFFTIWLGSLSMICHAQSLNLGFQAALDCSSNEICTTIQVKADQTTAIGSSSIFLEFNKDALSLIDYQSSNFDGADGCGGFWSDHAVDFNNDTGLFLVTMVLTSDGTSCPTLVADEWIDVGTLCFSVIDDSLYPQIEFNEIWTEFSTKDNNTTMVPINEIENLDGPFALNCGGIYLSANVMLEGYYVPEEQKMRTTLLSAELLPSEQPFNQAPINYNGTEMTTAFPINTVDWILLEFKDVSGNTVLQKAALLNELGEITDLNGFSAIYLPDLNAGSYYLVIRHKNHLSVASAVPLIFSEGISTSYDFTTSINQAFGEEQMTQISGNKYGLYAGDYDQNGLFNAADSNLWKVNNAGVFQYFIIDGDGNGVVNTGDYNLWRRNKSKVGASLVILVE